MRVPITSLHGVGVRANERLARLGIFTVEDALFHLPIRYEDRTCLTAVSDVTVGENALVEGMIQSVEVKISTKRSLVCMFSDETGTMMLRFFHFSPAQKQQLQIGTRLRCFGEIRQGYHCLELIHPDYQFIDLEKPIPLDVKLTPVYPSSEGLTQKLLRSIIAQSFEYYGIVDYLPSELLARLHLPSLSEALHTVHHPPTGTSIEKLESVTHPAQQRLAFEELLAQHLSFRILRLQVNSRKSYHLASTNKLVQKLLDYLPFQLTAAQKQVFSEIMRDLRAPHPMQRLMQGDVGSGKTIVALLVALQAIESGYQVAVMVPTELLAEQHHQTMSEWLIPLKIKPVLLTGSLGKKKRRLLTDNIASGEWKLIIGTHALFQESITFANLGLVIIDEQHRFGVHQRLALRNKGNQNGVYPHQLIMTATPIPRTLTMTIYADLDISVIDELPPGRTPIDTVALPNSRRDDVILRIQSACQQGRQAYWVCTLIEESEVLQCQAAEKTAAYLIDALPNLRIGLVHGRMKSKQKEDVMTLFKTGNLDLLVATTVIEVGIDVPNASLMIIENAERFGLAQLHQLRGRVGRSSVQSYCVLLYQPPLSRIARSRLDILRRTNDGFDIAQQDLELRGPGEVLGTKQAGVLNLRIADLNRDKALLHSAVKISTELINRYPDNCQQLIKRWVKEGLNYGEV
jgi:ATP-dependent DNA helicase RecG